jgi:hypothetical protein
MTTKEKILHVKSAVDEAIEINPSGPKHIRFYSVSHPELGEDHTILSRSEYRNIVRKFADDGYIKNLVIDEDRKGAWFEQNSNAETIAATKGYAHKVEQAEVQDSFLIFTITKNGILSRRSPLPGEGSYTIEEDSRRHKVLRVLIASRGEYCSTVDLAAEVSCTAQEFRTTCGEIRLEIEDHFSGVKGKDIIEGKKGSGYRINPKARIAELP